MVETEGAEAALDFEKSSSLIEDFWGKMGGSHDFLARAVTGGYGLKNFSFDVCIAKKFGLAEFFVFFNIVLREEFAQDVV